MFHEEEINSVFKNSVVSSSNLLILSTFCYDCDNWSFGSYCSLFLPPRQLFTFLFSSLTAEA